MQIFKNISDLKEYLSNLNGSIGFVPTMGALHNGHASLIKKSVSQNDHTIVSVFVNPTQFLPGEDYEKYPRNEENDKKICESCKADILFMPSADEIYSSIEPKVIAPLKVASILEGATRPGHFDGVLTIISKFFNIIQPDNAYFGKKDAQQLFLIQNLVKTMFYKTKINPCEIVREDDGLALSSRNSYLNDEEKMLALKISRALNKAKSMVENGEVLAKDIKAKMSEILEPLKIDYIAFVTRDFKEINKIEPENSIILVAVYLGKTRLIDNLWI